jgi:AcrR family transcriptional regulator
VTPERGSAREKLLDRCVAYLQEAGFSQLSLREIAAGAGSSHRMLIYHFGSREQLLAEVVGRVESAQRDALADLVSAEHDLAEVSRQFWRRISDPALAPAERLFFEIHSHALYERPWTGRFRASVIAAWVGPLADILVQHGYPPGEAHLRARLGLAATRGLLLDLLVTGDRDTLDAASDLLSRLITCPAGACDQHAEAADMRPGHRLRALKR